MLPADVMALIWSHFKTPETITFQPFLKRRQFAMNAACGKKKTTSNSSFATPPPGPPALYFERWSCSSKARVIALPSEKSLQTAQALDTELLCKYKR